jgi:hypothetical protein
MFGGSAAAAAATTLGPSAIHPELLAHFADQQREQQRHVQTAVVGRNVRATHQAALALLDKYVERGLQMDEGERRAEAVLRESQRFAHEAQGVNTGFFRCLCIPAWWFDCNGGSVPSHAHRVGKTR